jgi:hypothetical protein
MPAVFSKRACRPRALNMAASRASPPLLGNASQYNLGEAIQEREQSLLGSSEPKDFFSDPLDAGYESFFGADELFAAPRQFLTH